MLKSRADFLFSKEKPLPAHEDQLCNEVSSQGHGIARLSGATDVWSRRTFEEYSLGMDPSTFESRTIKRKGGEFRKSERKRREGRERKRQRKFEECDAQKKEMVEEVQRAHHSSVYDESGEWQKGEGKQKRCLGKFGKWLFLLLILGQHWLSVSAAAEGSQRRTEAVISMQQEVQIKERSLRERAPKRWKKPKGRDTKEMVEEAKVLRCTLVDVEDRESA